MSGNVNAEQLILLSNLLVALTELRRDNDIRVALFEPLTVQVGTDGMIFHANWNDETGYVLEEYR